MRAVLQRVSQAGVTVENKDRVGIDQGLVVLVAVRKDDSEEAAVWLAQKVLALRVFEDEQRKMNRSVVDVRGQVLVISQFTLYGECRKGRRPGFDQSAPPEIAIPLYRRFIEELKTSGLTVCEGEFGAMMAVDLINQGPVTLILDSPCGSTPCGSKREGKGASDERLQ
jgi:D-tyrosyl-tRNA(Tyr) deacylase